MASSDDTHVDLVTTRIRELREGARLSVEGLAEVVGISTSQMSRIERGERDARLSEARRIAQFFAVSLDEIVAAKQQVPMLGYVGAGAEAHFYADGHDLNEFVDAPDGATATTRALEIRGNSLGELFDRWLVFYDDVRSPVTPDLHGRLCVAGLEDDRVLVKKLKPSRTRGLYHLLSNTEAPIFDVPLRWAARVTNMVPR